MKKLNILIVLIVLVCMLLLSSCTSVKSVKSESIIYETDINFNQWKGEDPAILSREPSGIAWVRPTIGVPRKYHVHKRFSFEQWSIIMNHICRPPEPDDYSSLAKEIYAETLRVSFLNGREPVEIKFYLDETAERFVGPLGRSKKLFEIFTETEVAKSYWGGPYPSGIPNPEEYQE